MMDLISRQDFEGFWELNDGLAKILGQKTKTLAEKCPVKVGWIYSKLFYLKVLQTLATIKNAGNCSNCKPS